MSITPNGRRKDQIRQGGYKNNSILDVDLFEKVAITGTEELRGGPTETPSISNDLQGALSGGGLDHGGMADQLGADRNPPDPQRQPGIAPAGGAPADQFLGPAPVEDEAQQAGIDPYAEEMKRIRSYIGYQNYGLDVTPQKDQSLEIVVTPPPGQPVDIGRF